MRVAEAEMVPVVAAGEAGADSCVSGAEAGVGVGAWAGTSWEAGSVSGAVPKGRESVDMMLAC